MDSQRKPRWRDRKVVGLSHLGGVTPSLPPYPALFTHPFGTRGIRLAQPAAGLGLRPRGHRARRIPLQWNEYVLRTFVSATADPSTRAYVVAPSKSPFSALIIKSLHSGVAEGETIRRKNKSGC